MPDWQRELRGAVRDADELCRLLELDTADVLPDGAGFPMRVPRAFVARMQRGNRHDPLLRQVLPLTAESLDVPGYGPDPVGDQAAMPLPGLLHKYHGRVLLTVTGACAIHCRYCFRREFPYADANPRRGEGAAALAHIRSDPSIREVILSGGDPLSLTDTALAELVDQLAAIDHVETVRLHTRLPVVLPSRIDAGLLAWLQATRLHKVVVIHANHPHEIDQAVTASMRKLAESGAVVLNQSVLLRGVNDCAETLGELSRRLFAAGVLPYYLHVLDPVRGAAHFRVPDREAAELVTAVAARLPGYLVPRLVREDPGQPGKTPVHWDWQATSARAGSI